MPIFKNFGKPKDTIANYLKPIEQYYIPSLNNLFDVMIDTSPILTRETYVVYEDSDIGLKVDISSNHRDITEAGDLFVSVSYNNMKNDVGIINFANKSSLEDAVDLTLNALHEIGFKTGDEQEAEKEKAELEKRYAEEKKKSEERKRKARWSDNNIENEYADEPEDSAESEDENDDYDERKQESTTEIKSAIDYVGDLGGDNQTITVEWLTTVPTDNNQFKTGHLYVILTKVSGKNFLLQNRRISPKVETIVNDTKAMDYIQKVSDKLRTIPNVEVKDDKGKEIKVPSEYSDEPVNLDIDI